MPNSSQSLTDLGDGMPQGLLTRRSFLEAAGFTLSIAAVSGCGRAPQRLALPFPEQPANVISGVSKEYASTCHGCSAGCGLLVQVRDGRPLKMEGLPEHPLSRGGLCATGQAMPLGLYDSRRLKQPLERGKISDWSKVDTQIRGSLKSIVQLKLPVRFVTPTLPNPTVCREIARFLKQFPDGQHVVFDSVSNSAIPDAHALTHGSRVLPHYGFSQAKVIVSVGADFLGTWISPVEFASGWASRRRPTAAAPQMSQHIQIEGKVSLSGTKADRRFRVSPHLYGAVLTSLASRLAVRAGGKFPVPAGMPSPLPETDIQNIANLLWDHRGESLVVSDTQDTPTQTVVNFINDLLGNYGKTLDIDRPSLQRQGDDRAVQRLIKELESGKIGGLFVAGTDLTHNLPDHDKLSKGIQHIPLVVSFAEREDDFGSIAHFICPDHHPLESWMDSEPVSGVLSLTQPTIQPLGQTRSLIESLARWTGRNETSLEMIRSFWKSNLFSKEDGLSFDAWWNQVLHDGVYTKPSEKLASKSKFRQEGVRIPGIVDTADGFVLELHPRIGLPDSRHAHNPWLQELPDPITKTTWENCLSISPHAAQQLAVADGDVVAINDPKSNLTVELPVVIQAGQSDDLVSVPLGYGVRGTDRFSRIGPQWLESRSTVEPGGLVGKNVAGLLQLKDSQLQYLIPKVSLRKTGRSVPLACTQLHHRLEIPKNVAPYGAEVRNVVQQTTLAEFAKDPHAGEAELHHPHGADLWPDDHPHKEHHWAMMIDQNACTGCSACLIACQSENNVPVVGKDEVYRQREMHWLRIDRYYSGDDDDLQVAHQPMMCQHCGNAPCETVCPALATAHSDEGLNEQVYNRCVGTRYCANNCPYKVRRFNWFAYAHNDLLQNLVLNPDVAVRTRGVMEKCSLCVQRIEEGKIAARKRGEPIADGEIQTACQQSCPAKAISFGDLNDSQSRVHALMKDPRQYKVLDEFNFKTSVAYLRIVRNRPDGIAGAEKHG